LSYGTVDLPVRLACASYLCVLLLRPGRFLGLQPNLAGGRIRASLIAPSI